MNSDVAYHRCTFMPKLTLVVLAIHVGVAFTALTSAGGKLGRHVMSGGNISLGGIARNTTLAFQRVGSPACVQSNDAPEGKTETTRENLVPN